MGERITQVPVLPPRAAETNKGSYGRVLIVAGSRGMSGAAILSGSAALRGGAGLVKVAVPGCILPIVAAANPCYLTAPLLEDKEGRMARIAEQELWELTEANDVTALGPGLSRSADLTHIVTTVVTRSLKPLVLDADGLNALEGETDLLRQRPAATVLTPHPGEFGRLLGVSAAEVQANRQELAVRF